MKTKPQKTNVIFVQPSFDYKANTLGGGLKKNQKQGWAIPLIRSLMKQTDKYIFQSWSMYDSNLEKMNEEVIDDTKGFRIHIFPSRKFLRKPFSMSLIYSMKHYLKKNPKTIVYVLSQPHIGMTHFLSLLCGSRIPFVAGQGGPRGQPLWKFHFSNNIFFLLQHFIDWFSVRLFYDIIICGSIGEYCAIKSQHGISKLRIRNKPTLFRDRNGANFDEYKPIDKLEFRRKLGLPLDRNILVHIGRYNRYKDTNTTIKGLNQIIKGFEKLRKRKKIELLLIGGRKEEELYYLVKQSNAIHIGPLKKEELLDYLSASDIFISLGGVPEFEYFSGLGSSPMEAISLGVPVIGKKWHGYKKIQQVTGAAVTDFKNVEEAIHYTLKKDYNQELMWNVCKLLFSQEKIVENHMELYEFLEEKYFNIK